MMVKVSVVVAAMAISAPAWAQESNAEDEPLEDLYARPDADPGPPLLHELRLEIAGTAGVMTGTDPRAIPAGGLTARMYVSESVALGLEGGYYGGYEDESRVPPYQADGGRMSVGWQALWIGDSGAIGDSVYDVGLLIGSGIIGSRAVPEGHAQGLRVQVTPYADFGMMLRVFITRWMSTGIEARHDIIFYDGKVAPAFEARGGLSFWLPLQTGWDLSAAQVASR
jgi:hypothetical protein